MIITKDNWDAARWPNFTPDELACKHCGELAMDMEFLDDLETLRIQFFTPFIISSGYRCKNHPVELGKTTTGAHPQGKAVDIIMEGKNAFALIDWAVATHFDGIGISQRAGNPRFIHLDKYTDLPRPAVWSY